MTDPTDAPTTFTADEIATVRKLFAWIEEGGWLSGGYEEKAIRGADNDGLIVSEYRAVGAYDGYELESEERTISWLALTDPDKYDEQCEAEKRQQEAERAARVAAQNAHLRAQEYAAYQALKAKYG